MTLEDGWRGGGPRRMMASHLCLLRQHRAWGCSGAVAAYLLLCLGPALANEASCTSDRECGSRAVCGDPGR